MRLRQRRGTGTNRRAIAAVVIAGVLVAGGATSMQFANASTTTKAADVIVVNKQNFDVSGCTQLEVDGDNVVCDGELLAPQAEQGGDAAAQDSALALETACDTFAADAADQQGDAADQKGDAADQKGDAADQKGDAQRGAGNIGGADKPAVKAAANKMAKKWAKKMKAAGESEDPSGDGDEGAAADEGSNGDAAADSAAEVTAAQEALLQACLTLAEAKATADAAGGDANDQEGDNVAGD